ncbi:hypothetical protein CGC20_2395 [Leishmania donovani]|uniref:Uncharacterized protein n=1 Tax=Leishmania donovani TaxID=5661 RepID=A0A504XRT2_LEIDO|nr:hypothetical protein CGC20_2395 [Leishmania donovani]
MSSQTRRHSPHASTRFVSRQRARAGPSRRWVHSSDTCTTSRSSIMIGTIRDQNLHVRRTSAFSQIVEAHGVQARAGVIRLQRRKREAARGLAIHEKPVLSDCSGTSPSELNGSGAPSAP